ncbi:MAG: N(4)-(beta-N-acetylglucosaminyl)-L-asparaginase [Flavobacteriia bacterium]|nr:N(4)-(beta-N-acetylglucosaminyl)-L-asparaginase [Flavobacteriia bacterium]
MNRRKYLKLSVLGFSLISIHNKRETKIDFINENMENRPNLNKAKVISTWSHGLEANKKAWEVLQNKNKILDAIEEGLKVTEADVTNRSVGIGGLPDCEGKVTLDACIMDEKSRCGSVAFLEGIAHPISVARKIMETTPHVMLVGEGAKQFALKNNFKTIQTPLPEVQEAYEKWKKEQKQTQPQINHENHDTIGMLAIDENGNISGGCTTSGWAYKLHGRVGDSPIIGAGLFIDNEIGGAVATGMGEAIIRIAGSHTVVELMRQGKSPQKACQMAVERIISKHDNLVGLQCAFLAINKKGEVGAYSVYEGFNFAFTNSEKHELINAEYNRKW